MSDVKAPAPNPCGSCPYRRDVPSGIWAAEEYTKLKEYDHDMASQATGLFLCHQHDAGSEHQRLCSGWVGHRGPDHLLALRLASAFGSMSREELDHTFDYTSPVPLFTSGHEAAEHGMRDIDAPDEDAERAIAKIVKRRNDVRMG
ncbi:DUF6283 family protein [Mycobacterium phage DyoEdafos]|uniref:Uncharacterized protein n=1 Tax=Mycobacterium phage DyoEdafos TaxID=2599860 RepID=A0A5J6TKP7_9CAUD|nr:DUF6283 family protein [Mycobacterium phage DyoEdafos]QFG10349.1 hypothetical protein SEA_DYOEDAFOS_137 [Mycobacterium phage DyoEdafos]